MNASNDGHGRKFSRIIEALMFQGHGPWLAQEDITGQLEFNQSLLLPVLMVPVFHYLKEVEEGSQIWVLAVSGTL